MSSLAFSGHGTTASGSRRLRDLGAVLAAVVATGLVWLIATTGFGLDLYQPGFGTMAPQQLTMWWAAATTGLAGLAAWGVLAIIERFSRRPARACLVVSVGLLVLSLGGPLSGDGITTGNRLALAFMHLAAGAVLIPLYFRSTRFASRWDR
jgi:Family of unknown function (DUF6069)